MAASELGSEVWVRVAPPAVWEAGTVTEVSFESAAMACPRFYFLGGELLIHTLSLKVCVLRDPLYRASAAH